MASGNKKNKKVRNVILITITTILTVIIVVAGSLFAVANYYVSMIPKSNDGNDGNGNDPSYEDYGTGDQPGQLPDYDGYDDEDDYPEDPDLPPMETMDPADVEWETPDSLPDVDDDGLLNIMIVGQDTRSNKRERSDTMLLISINPKSNNVSLISFLRDIWVQIPGGSDNRLNVPYARGGFELLRKTLKTNFGVTIDGFFECNFNSFIDVIDTLGGVKITLTEKEVNYMKNSMGVKGVKVGENNLDGIQALSYARIRKIDSDWGRTNRQRKIILSLFDEFKDANIMELKATAEQLLPKMKTDMSNGDIMSLMLTMLPKLSSMKLSSYSVPSSGTYQNKKIGGRAVLVPNLSKIRTQLANEYLPK